jgi:nucleotide-binding universal stress UspA family protein
MKIKKILWPTDLSDNSRQVLGLVQDLAQGFGAEVHLLYVAEGIKNYDHIYGDANPEFLRGFQEMENRRAQEKMDQVCADELKGCPAIFRHLLAGDPPREILRLTRELPADLIVMATRGRGQADIGSVLIGTVVERVVRHAATPVLLVNPAGTNVYPDLAPQTPRGHDDQA